jgi:predicted nucleotidyltransferase
MAPALLPKDFKEFLRLLGAHSVEYLLIGGYAVAYHGYPRATADLDVWISLNPINAEKTVAALREFGFDLPDLRPEIFLQEHKIIRLGRPPLRIEIATSISGVTFENCYRARLVTQLDGVAVSLIDLEHLKINKRAAGRHKDLDDLENLP